MILSAVLEKLISMCMETWTCELLKLKLGLTVVEDDTIWHVNLLVNTGVTIMASILKSSSPGQNGRHFPDDILKCSFINEKFCISIRISLKFVHKGPIDSIPALVQIMACRWHELQKLGYMIGYQDSFPQNRYQVTCPILIIINWSLFNICSGNGLVPNRQQVITWTNYELAYWPI